MRRNNMGAARGFDNDERLENLDRELELLRKKRMILEQRQHGRGDEQHSTRQQLYNRNDSRERFASQESRYSQDFNNRFNYSDEMHDGNYATPGRKRQFSDQRWQAQVPNKRFAGSQKGKKKASGYNQSQKPSGISAPQPLIGMNVGFMSDHPMFPNTSNRNMEYKRSSESSNKFKSNKISKPKPSPPPNKLHSYSQNEIKNLVATASDLVQKLKPAVIPNIYCAEQQPTKQMIGRMELALGDIIKEVKAEFSETHPAIMLSRILRHIKQTIRDRIKNVMLGKPIDKYVDIIKAYRDVHPKTTDQEMVEFSVDCIKALEKNIVFNVEENSEKFFERNMKKLILDRLDTMFEKLRTMYEEDYKTKGKLSKPEDGAGNFEVTASNEKTDNFEVTASNEETGTIKLTASNEETGTIKVTASNEETGTIKATDNNEGTANIKATINNEETGNIKLTGNSEESSNIKATGDSEFTGDSYSTKDTFAVSNNTPNTDLDASVTIIENDKTESNIIIIEDDDNVEVSEKSKVSESSELQQDNDMKGNKDENGTNEEKLDSEQCATLVDKVIAQKLPQHMKKSRLRYQIADILYYDQVFRLTRASIIMHTTGNFELQKQKYGIKTPPKPHKLPETKPKQDPALIIPYYVRITGKPYLPKKKVMQKFLEDFNPRTVKKHKSHPHLLFVGFLDKENYDKILAANETVIGNSRLNIKISERGNKDKSQENNVKEGNTEALSNDKNKLDSDLDVINPELDNKITELISSIRKDHEDDENKCKESASLENLDNVQGDAVTEKILNNMSVCNEEKAEVGQDPKTDDNTESLLNDENKLDDCYMSNPDLDNKITELISSKGDEDKALEDCHSAKIGDVTEKTENNVSARNEKIAE